MATYNEVLDIPNHPEVYLIDVRNKKEIAESGSLPESLNIPLGDLNVALEMPPKAFEETYNRPKPTTDSVLIFSCYRGGRALSATHLALNMGYKNAKPYLGSWLEWSTNNGLTES